MEEQTKHRDVAEQARGLFGLRVVLLAGMWNASYYKKLDTWVAFDGTTCD